MKVRINTHGNPLPESHGEWVDLYTAEDTVLEPLGFKIISLGVAMELPAGYYAQVVPRSSTCKNFGVIMANSMGVIENSYCGNDDIWGFPAVAIRGFVNAEDLEFRHSKLGSTHNLSPFRVELRKSYHTICRKESEIIECYRQETHPIFRRPRFCADF